MPLSPGICGYVNFDDKPLDSAVFARMREGLSGNGERQEVRGQWYAMAQCGYNSTGHEGSCTSASEDNVLVMEGRISNRTVLMNALQMEDGIGYAAIFRKGLQRCGMDFLREVSGAFSMATLDTRSHLLRLFRDPIALRPLYYVQENDRVLFGSDVRQLLSAGGRSPVTKWSAK